ncbi:MAG: hypothetical protein ACOCSM_00900 [Bacillota bacterium]
MALCSNSYIVIRPLKGQAAKLLVTEIVKEAVHDLVIIDHAPFFQRSDPSPDLLEDDQRVIRIKDDIIAGFERSL